MASRQEIEDQVMQDWAGLATAWRVNPVLSRIHALLLLSGTPLTADDICERMRISRASASVQLNAILEWGLARRVHVPGDRRQHFEADQDHWSWFRRAAAVRKAREFDPTVERIGLTLARARAAGTEDDEMAALADRLGSLQQFVSELFRGVTLALEIDAGLLRSMLQLSAEEEADLLARLRDIAPPGTAREQPPSEARATSGSDGKRSRPRHAR